MEKKKIAMTALWAAIPLIFFLRFGDFLTIHALNNHRSLLCLWAEANTWSAPLAYITLMSVFISFTVPGATTLSFAGGIIFQQPWAALYAYIGFVVGACGSYWAVRLLFWELASGWLKGVKGYSRMEKNLKEHGFMYLVFARYTLVFPFWLVNAASAIVGVPFLTFAAATAVAVIPGSYIYTTAGRALSSVLDNLDDEGVRNINISEIVRKTVLESTQVQICLIAIVVGASAPFIHRFIRK